MQGRLDRYRRTSHGRQHRGVYGAISHRGDCGGWRQRSHGRVLDYIKPNITEISWSEVEADLEFTIEAGEEPEFDGSVVREVRPMELVANEGGVITVTGDFTDVETVACRVGTFGPIAGRRVDARTVECFAPYHVSGVVEISVNGAMGVALQYVAPAYVEDVVFDDSAPVEEVYEPVFDATSLRGVEPANVTTTEGGVITISGSFRGVESVACRVGTIGPMFGRLIGHNHCGVLRAVACPWSCGRLYQRRTWRVSDVPRARERFRF